MESLLNDLGGSLFTAIDLRGIDRREALLFAPMINYGSAGQGTPRSPQRFIGRYSPGHNINHTIANSVENTIRGRLFEVRLEGDLP